MNQKQIQQMMKQAQKMQSEMENTQAEIEAKEFSHSTGGGMVNIKMTGDKKITEIEIKEEILDPEEKDMLQELIVLAVNNLIQEIEDETANKMKSYTNGLPF